MTIESGESPPNELLKRGRQLEAMTLAWNVVGVVVLAFAALDRLRLRDSGSTALLKSRRRPSFYGTWRRAREVDSPRR